MKPKIWKMLLVGCVALSVFILVILKSQYGEYDHRNFPSKLKLSAKADKGYHVHVQLGFYPTREIPILCIPIMGTARSGSITQTFNDISEKILELELKKKWAGFCRYQFSILGVACTQTPAQPSRVDGTWESVGIGLLLGDQETKAWSDLTFGSHTPILENTLTITGDGKMNRFYGCDSGCEKAQGFGINNSNEIINIACKDQ